MWNNITQLSAVHYIAIYLAAVNLWAAILVLCDKRAARRSSWRVKERTLLFVSAIGGSVAMLAVMRLVRHKTKHTKFMVGIPVIIILQIAVVIFIWWRMNGGVV